MLKILQALKVYDCGFSLTRLGRDNDGGYIIPDELMGRVKQIVTCGVGDDISFEVDALRKYSNIEKAFLFDPMVDFPAIPKDLAYQMFFYKVPAKDGISFPCESTLLKVDIEGNEWELFWETPYLFLRGFDIIIVEFHFFTVASLQISCSPYFRKIFETFSAKNNKVIFKTYYDVIKRMNIDYKLIHIHPNNSLPLIEVDGVKFPPLLECTFVNKNLVNKLEEKPLNKIKLDIDQSNKTDRPDIEVGEFYVS